MDDALAVRGCERRADLANDRHHLVERDHALREPLRERLALEVLEHEERHTIGSDVEVVDLHDVRVVHPGGDLRLALEPELDIRIRDLGVQDLDGDPFVREGSMTRHEHHPHAAAADQGLDHVLIDDRSDVDGRTSG